MTGLLASCSVYQTDLPDTCCDQKFENDEFSQKEAVINSMNKLVAVGVPGVAIAVRSKEGWWHYATGLAKIEDQSPMKNGHLHYLQSIAKLYLAVAIMKLVEEDKMDIAKPVTYYLPWLSDYFEEADRVTVKMLMNHTSGIPEYNSEPSYFTQLLQNPTRDWTPEEYLEVVKGKSLVFEPGSRFWYCNMNYEILALIADEVTGDHAKYLDTIIFQPLGITRTFYRNHDDYLQYPEIYNAYWDRYSDGIIENVSTTQRQNVSDMIGDDGMVSTPHDAVAFLSALFNEEIISQKSLNQMMEWEKNRSGEDTYGLGLDLGDFQGNPGIGHSGGGLGAGCQLYYFPEKEMTIFIGINLGTVTESPIHSIAEPIVEKIYDQLLN